MTKKNAKEFLALVQALADGKTIQIKYDEKWVDHTDITFVSPLECYRIKPNTPRDIWVNEFTTMMFAHESKESALAVQKFQCIREAVHYREVIQ